MYAMSTLWQDWKPYDVREYCTYDRVDNDKNEGFQNFSKLWQYKGILGLTLILSWGYAPIFHLPRYRPFDFFQIFAKFAKRWAATVILAISN